MKNLWSTLTAVAVVNAALKAVGPALIGKRNLPSSAREVIGLLAPALMAALIVVQTLGSAEGAVVVDARSLGLGTAAIAVSLRLPSSLAVVGAAAVTALARALS
jgi:hypothetical protein